LHELRKSKELAACGEGTSNRRLEPSPFSFRYREAARATSRCWPYPPSSARWLAKFFSSVCITQSRNANSSLTPQSGTEMGMGRESSEKDGPMTKREECVAQEREEIATRIAKFKATQQKFEREREEYFLTTMQNARNTERPSFWS
jgi:hypothetical protein